MAAPHADSNGGSNNSYASYPDSGDSSPRYRGTDCDNSSPAAALDDVPPPLPPPHTLSHRHVQHHPPAQRVKFMCSYGGRIQPRIHDNELSYVGGDTKIVAVDRSIRYLQLLARLAALMPAVAGDVCFKYQLPGEDLDALISVTNDEDVDHMIVEYDRLQRSSTKPARLRLFLFPVGPVDPGFVSSDSKPSDRHWFVDALNSVPAPPAPLVDSLPPPVPLPGSGIGNPDFLFGLEKGFGNFPSPLAIHDLTPEAKVSADASPVDDETPATTGSDSTKEDNWIVGGGEPPVAHQPEIQRQIQELETLHVESQQETPAAACHSQQRRREGGADEKNHTVGGYPGEYRLQPKGQVVQENAQAVRQIPVAYVPERMMAEGGVYSSLAALDGAVYVIPSPAPQGVYASTVMPAMTGQASQGYYTATKQSVRPEAALHQTAYMAPPPPQPSAKTVGAYAKQGGLVEASGVINAVAPQLLAACDSAGRPLYYVRSGPPTGGSVIPAYQTQRVASAADAVRSDAAAQATQPAAAAATAVTTAQLLNPEGKVAAKPLQAS